MRVDFYQLGESPLPQVIAGIASKLVEQGERALIVATDEAALARLDRMLWETGPTSFLGHGIAGGANDMRQPILLSTTEAAPNMARALIIADGEWREAALTFERAFYLFDENRIADARLAWKLLAGRAGVERRYWATKSGKWVEKG